MQGPLRKEGKLMKDLLKIMGAISLAISICVGADTPATDGVVVTRGGTTTMVVTHETGEDEEFFMVAGAEDTKGAPPPQSLPYSLSASDPTAWEKFCGVGKRFVDGASTLYSTMMAQATAAKCNTSGISQDEFCSLTLKELLDFSSQYSDKNPLKFWTTFRDTKRLSRLGIFDIQFGVVLGGDDKEVHGTNFFDFLTEKVTQEPAIHFQKEMAKGRTESKTDIPGENGEARKTMQYYSRYTNCDGKGMIIFVTLHAFRKTEKYF